MPLLAPTMNGRNEIFQRLKPRCVSLSQAAVALNGPSGDVRTITQKLEDLAHELIAVTSDSAALDSKLADYVFFPLSQVLKASQKVSIRSLELSLQCLAILIDRGWRGQVQPQLAAQVNILCTLMGEKNPQHLASVESTDELQASSFKCLHALFGVIHRSSETAETFVKESNIPQLGQTITVLLEGIHDDGSTDRQLAAAQALQSLLKNVTTLDIQAGFLPGIVSKLSRVLTLQTSMRRNHATLVAALNILTFLFQSTLGPHTEIVESDNSKVIDAEWLMSASVKLKPAVASVVRLRRHGRFDVREALADFCLVVLKHCQPTLADCGSMCLDALLILSSDQVGDAIKFRLEALVNANPTILAMLHDTLHEWLQALPVKMQAADEDTKIERLEQIRTAYDLVVGSGSNSSLINRLFADALRDSVGVTIQVPSAKSGVSLQGSHIQSLDLPVVDGQHGSTHFDMPLIEHLGQKKIMLSIQQLCQTINTSSSSTAFAAALSRSLRHSYGDTQVAAFWLLLESTRAAMDHKYNIDDLLNINRGSAEVFSGHLEELYSFALDVLAGSTDDVTDRKLQALALRSLALRAKDAGREFRFELIDALYPVLHTLATPNKQLQQDSITALNVFTVSCGYDSVEELIVDNVDYLTNAVALKLNAFDVSPQAPQVLLMMVRLAGPSLLPYLEDTVNSIFAALEDYHGYPLLVELLFKVLSVVADEGTKTPQMAITSVAHRVVRRFQADTWQPVALPELTAMLRDRAKDEAVAAQQPLPREPHPRIPWKDSELTGRDNEAEEETGDEENEQQPVDTPDPPPPVPKTYNLLLRICELTQHFLPSASASLRTSLLTLVKTTIPAIARHENSFLPLINTIWPEVVSRLDDAEPFMVATALDTVASLCEYAGDFMRSRVLHLWPHLLEIHRNSIKQIVNGTQPNHNLQYKDRSSITWGPVRADLNMAVARMHSSPADYHDTATRLVWVALVQLMTTIIRNVPIPPELFDEALEMLEPVLQQVDIREALEIENPDAVWLVRLRLGALTIPDCPVVVDDMQWAAVSVIG